jgi:protein-disulfide isomerase
MKRILPFAIILLVLGVAVVSAYYLKSASNPTPSTPPSNPGSPGGPTAPVGPGGPVAPTATPGGNSTAGAEPAHKLGPDSAYVKIEEFGDFQCPPCGMFHPILEQMHGEFGDQIQIIFREFPLVPAHQHAVTAASAAEAAGLQGKFWEMHNLIYEHQTEWKDQFDVRPIFEGFAKQIGLNVDKYKTDLNGDAVAQRLFLDGKRGRELGVKGTPTVFINGRELPFESLPADKLRVVIKNELAKK